jgi:hypothetical protein
VSLIGECHVMSCRQAMIALLAFDGFVLR